MAMQKGTLNITRSKKGKIIVYVVFIKEGKTKPQKLTANNTNITDLSLTGKEVEFERDKNGHIIKIISQEGKELFLKSVTKTFTAKAGQKTKKIHEYNGAMITDHTDSLNRRAANAPYNFIPLNKKVVEAEKIPGFDKYHEDRKTGWIDITIETITPVYIRDTLDNDEIKQQEEAKKNNRPFIHPDFFSPKGKLLRIPGSSLRGMTRTMVEITAFGRFLFFDDKRLYFRDVAGSSRQGAYYKKIMVDVADKSFPRIKAGLLKVDKAGHCKIYPSAVEKGTQIYRVNFNKGTNVVNSPTNFIVPEFKFEKIFFQPVPPAPHPHRFPLKYALVKSVSKTKDTEHPLSGYVVASGKFGSKHMHWVINKETNPPIDIPEKVKQEYKNDVSRNKNADLLKELTKRPNGIPCFYITDTKNEIISFGHTGMFRLAFNKSIKEHIPRNLVEVGYAVTDERLDWIRDEDVPEKIIEQLKKLGKNEFTEKEFEKKLDAILQTSKEEVIFKKLILKHIRRTDIPEAIFGNETLFAGRVFFEDAFCKDDSKDVLMSTKTPKILSNPKPTTFQHYLVQDSDNRKELYHYSDNVSIRGNKLYWHRSGEVDKWEETNLNNLKNSSKQYTQINPVKKGTEFSGKIRFENLSDVELGALLFSLDLQSDCYHKIGMGKPLGLGSIKITPKLFISIRKDRYNNLSSEWNNAIEASDKTTTDKLKNSFEKYVLEQINETSTSELWETERLKELSTMLDYNKGKELEKSNKISYMSIQRKEFTERFVLPLPSQV